MPSQLVVIFSLFLGFINIFNAFSSGVLWWRQKETVFRDLFIFWCFGVLVFLTTGLAQTQTELVKVLSYYVLVIGNSCLVFLFSSILGVRISARRYILASIAAMVIGSGVTFAFYTFFSLRGFYLYLLPFLVSNCFNWILCGLAIRNVVLKRSQHTAMGWSFLVTVIVLGIHMLAAAYLHTQPHFEILGPGLGAAIVYAMSVFAFSSAIEVLEKKKTSAEMQIVKAERDSAEKLNQTKSLFLANISHELRTPMHGILSFARFGQQKIDSPKEKLKSYFDEISDSANRLMSLLNDLLDLATLEAGKMEMKPEDLDLFMIAQSAANQMASYATERGISFEVIRSSSMTETVFDEARMLQVFRNLLSNAVKFTKDKDVVRIEIEVVGDLARARVMNWGVGIPDNELETIFDKFVQSSKTSTGAGGTGLGLAICKEIIQRHDGRIWAENRNSGETVFTFEFPTSRERSTPSSAICKPQRSEALSSQVCQTRKGKRFYGN